MHGLDWALVCGLYRCNNHKKKLRAKINESFIEHIQKCYLQEYSKDLDSLYILLPSYRKMLKMNRVEPW